MQTEIEGIRASLGNIFHSTLRQHLCRVANALDWDFSLVQIVIAAHVFVRKEVGGAAHDSEELIEATLNWSEVW